MERICVPSDGEPKYPSFVYIFSSHLSLANTSKKINDPSLTTAATPQSSRPPTAATHSPPKLHRRRNIPSTSEEHTRSRFCTNSRDESTAVGGSDVKKVVISQFFREDIIRFRISLSTGILELKEEVAKRLKLEVGTFEIKYLDDDQEWVLIACVPTYKSVWIFQDHHQRET
ncbi:hypothetical protein Q3G72_016679 [Acer saccharum]|nr:hypothetical protein Q3G72_016679 [Acer saccharum]